MPLPEISRPAWLAGSLDQSIREVRERLRDKHGLSFTGEPHVVHRDAGGELWMTFTRDPDDHWIGLMQQRESSAATM